MSAKIVLTFEEVLAFLIAYDQEPLVEYHPLSAPSRRTHYVLTLGERPFLLTIWDHLNYQQADTLLRLQHRLHETGYPCPCPIETAVSDWQHAIHGHPAFLTPYLPGEPLTQEPGLGLLTEAGARLSQLHNHPAPAGLPDMQEWSSLRAAELAFVAPFIPEDVHQTLTLEDWVWPHDALPSGLCHGSWTPSNLLVHKQLLSGVLDFEQVFCGPWLFDIARSLNRLTSSAEEEDHFLMGYERHRTLSEEEFERLHQYRVLAARDTYLSRLYTHYHPETCWDDTDLTPYHERFYRMYLNN